MQLNFEQDKLVHAKPAGHMIIRGVAGSGKTTVGIHRAIYLRDNYCENAGDRVLVVTYNRILNDYLWYIYKKTDEFAKQISMAMSLGHVGELHISNIDRIMIQYTNDYLKEKKSEYKILGNSNSNNLIRRETIQKCIRAARREYKDISILDVNNYRFFLDEIEWMFACEYTELSEYQSADRVGGRNSKQGDMPQKLGKNSMTREAIYRIMMSYRKLLKGMGYIEFYEANQLALFQASKGVKVKYKHIIVDEAQDFSKVQLKFLNLLHADTEGSSMTFVADTAQSIYRKSWLRGRSYKSIGYDMKGKSTILSKNYRTTTQISQAAYSLIEKDKGIVEDENFVKPFLIDRQGNYPVYRNFNDGGEEAAYVAGEIGNLIATGYKYSDIAVLYRNKNLKGPIENLFISNNIPFSFFGRKGSKFEMNSIKLMTMHAAKGLEFRVVFIIGLNKDIIPYSSRDIEQDEINESLEKRLLYVGMTRANEKLYLTASGTPSRFIGDIEGKYLRLTPDTRILPLYKVHIDSYLFEDRLANKYGSEEKVRQWLLSELIHSYQYPVNRIDIEYKLKSFSKTGFADIVIYHPNKNSLEPFILCETKQDGSGIDEAVLQLKSYMSVCKTCEYGIATDGSNFVVIDKEFRAVRDIPVYESCQTESDLKAYTYTDFRTMKKCTLEYREYDENTLTMIYGKDVIRFKEGELVRLNVYSSIAAGAPIHMDDCVEDHFKLPARWGKRDTDHFLLKIKGDSMEKAGINNGDYVIIRLQPTAEILDIAAVDIYGEATLKRFNRAGSQIILTPENPKYEPIIIGEGQVRIIGVAVGVMREEG